MDKLEEALAKVKELEETVEQQNSTMTDQAKAIEEGGSMVEKLRKDAEASKSKPPEGISKEDFAKIKGEAETGRAALVKLGEIQGKADDETLKKEFPKIQDFAVVQGKTIEERRTSAKTLYAALGIKEGEEPEKKTEEKKTEEKTEAKKTEEKKVKRPWEEVEHTPKPTQEELEKTQVKERTEGLDKAVKAGPRAAMAECFRQQPKAVEALSTGKK